MKEDARKKTLPEVLGEYAARDMARFHMPGHKGFGIPQGASLWALDVTELPGTDNLHIPEGAIRATQLAYARAYGARDCFLLVNGSTAGALAMMLALGQNRRVLLARNCHRSAIAGAALAGHRLRYLYPHPEGVVCAGEVEAALRREKADAVYIVSPDSYGRCADLASIAQIAHAHGALMLVDAAHGAHFPFAESLPSLCPAHVDMFCVSAHKTLCAFTQAALLFTGPHCPIEKAHIQNMLALVQTTSPSYPLMLSLDWALHAARGWEAHVRRMLQLEKQLARANGIRVQSEANTRGQNGVFALDPTRLVVNVEARGISGQAAFEDLFARGVCPELADLTNLVFITTPQDPEDWLGRLVRGVSTLPYGCASPVQKAGLAPPAPSSMTVREAVLAPSRRAPLSESAGLCAACAVGLYPPGVAVLFPGERITEDVIAYLRQAQALGHNIFGLEEGENIRVIQESDV